MILREPTHRPTDPWTISITVDLSFLKIRIKWNKSILWTCENVYNIWLKTLFDLNNIMFTWNWFLQFLIAFKLNIEVFLLIPCSHCVLLLVFSSCDVLLNMIIRRDYLFILFSCSYGVLLCISWSWTDILNQFSNKYTKNIRIKWFTAC